MFKYEIRRQIGGKDDDKKPCFVGSTLHEAMVWLLGNKGVIGAEWLDPVGRDPRPIITLRTTEGGFITFYRIWRV